MSKEALRSKLSCGLFLAAVAALPACGPGADRPTEVAKPLAADAADGAVSEETSEAAEARGLRVHTADAAPGYVLYAPIVSDKTYLVDREGRVVHLWASDLAPGGAVYLLDNGDLLRTERVPEVPVFSGGGQAGRMRQLTWESEVVWDYRLASEEHLFHHDVEPLPNGNWLAIAWEAKTAEEARRAGRRPSHISADGIWPDKVIELEPLPPDGARIVWEWHAWDHLVQDTDPELPNYGDPARHPLRIDINGDLEPQTLDEERLAQLRALGYVDDEAPADELNSDLFHTNAVDYNAELDQIALSTPRFDEIWIVDHSTTTEEARGSTGGRWGRGGDLLYRWGNPEAYDRSQTHPKTLFDQHDVRWIEAGRPGAGNLMIYSNNNPGEDDSAFSEVVEIAPPVDDSGAYRVPESEPFGPREPAWSYTDPGTFHSGFISGATRLPNGNTLIAQGASGRIFEVTAAGEIAWEYWVPYSGAVRLPDGSPPHPIGPAQQHAVFRAVYVPPDHPALAGRTLEPLDPQPPIETAPWPEREEEDDRHGAGGGGGAADGSGDPSTENGTEG